MLCELLAWIALDLHTACSYNFESEILCAHSSTARRKTVLPRWLLSMSFSNLYGAARTWNTPAMNTIKTQYRLRHPAT